MKNPVRYMTVTYTASLAFVALMSIFIYLNLNEIIEEKYSSVETINTSGYQRALSQRSSLFANLFSTTGSNESQLLAVETLNRMLEAHRLLLAPHNDALALGQPSPLSAELQTMYFQPPLEVDAKIDAYQVAITQVIYPAVPVHSDSIDTYALMELKREGLLFALDAVVKQYEIESIEKIDTLRSYLKLSTTVLIATLIFIAIFINRPMVNRISRDARKNEESIKAQEEYRVRLERIAHYDGLTNLPNRVLLGDYLNQAMSQCQQRNRSLVVALMDLDDLKVINDTYGHSVGDELLVEVSHRMKAALRESDTLAHIGGDEFIAVMTDLENIEDSEVVLARLLKAAADVVTVGGYAIKTSVSIGLTLYPQDNVDADQLVRHADQAMYIAKQSGKNCYHLFDTAKNNEIETLQQQIGDIRSALDRREFVLHYQPKVNMHTGEVVGVEALIRWQHPDRGIIPPLEFLPVIEGHDVSLELGEWVIATALKQISLWKNAGINLPISVNISAYQLQQTNFTDSLAALLAARGEVNPNSLELEILETSALSDISRVYNTMTACHALGVRFALDDFGTGYSSLTYLKRLPAYLIKVDQSFVRGMLNDADNLAIVEGVVGLATAFQREVIAEGVETIAHREALLQLGCELGQGYGIARPMPASDIPKWATSWRAEQSWWSADAR